MTGWQRTILDGEDNPNGLRCSLEMLEGLRQDPVVTVGPSNGHCVPAEPRPRGKPESW